MKKRMFSILLLLVGILLGYLTCSFFFSKSQKAMSLVYVNVGQEYLQKRNYLKAIAYFNRAIALDQKSFIARISLPETYFADAKYDLALEEYEATLEVAKEEKWNESELKRIEKKIEEIRMQIRK
jgi:tetratricopeptide (TPR) repeat protein